MNPCKQKYQTTIYSYRLVLSLSIENRVNHAYARMCREYTHLNLLGLITGLNILDLINDLRNDDDEDLHIQCDVFDEEKQSDDDELAELNPECVNLNDTRQVFNAVFHKVYLYCSSNQTNIKFCLSYGIHFIFR